MLHIYRLYLKRLDKLQEWVPHNKTRKNVHIRPQSLNLPGTAPRSPNLHPLDLYLWESLQTLVYFNPTEDEKTLHEHISDASHTINNSPRDLSNDATVCDQTCPRVHSFTWMTFWASVMNPELIYDNN
jgi:hypothetical protein